MSAQKEQGRAVQRAAALERAEDHRHHEEVESNTRRTAEAAEKQASAEEARSRREGREARRRLELEARYDASGNLLFRWQAELHNVQSAAEEDALTGYLVCEELREEIEEEALAASDFAAAQRFEYAKFQQLLIDVTRRIERSVRSELAAIGEWVSLLKRRSELAAGIPEGLPGDIAEAEQTLRRGLRTAMAHEMDLRALCQPAVPSEWRNVRIPEGLPEDPVRTSDAARAAREFLATTPEDPASDTAAGASILAPRVRWPGVPLQHALVAGMSVASTICVAIILTTPGPKLLAMLALWATLSASGLLIYLGVVARGAEKPERDACAELRAADHALTEARADAWSNAVAAVVWHDRLLGRLLRESEERVKRWTTALSAAQSMRRFQEDPEGGDRLAQLEGWRPDLAHRIRARVRSHQEDLVAIESLDNGTSMGPLASPTTGTRTSPPAFQVPSDLLAQRATAEQHLTAILSQPPATPRALPVIAALLFAAPIAVAVGAFLAMSPQRDSTTFLRPRCWTGGCTSDLAYLEAQCRAGRPLSCVTIGVRHFEGRVTPKDYSKAFAYFQNACSGGAQRGCAWLGRMHFNGWGTASSPPQAVAYFRSSCAAGDLLGCNGLGVSYLNGFGVEKDEVRAMGLLEQACTGGEPLGCTNLGRQFAFGTVVPHDFPRALGLLDRACEGGEPLGCYFLASLLDNNPHVSRDEARAVRLYERACDADDLDACLSLGTKLSESTVVPHNLARAVSLFERVCSGGKSTGCMLLANYLMRGEGAPRDEARAVSLAQQACNDGWCVTLALFYANGQGVPRDRQRAYAMLQRDCDSGKFFSCDALGQMYLQDAAVERGPTRAAQLFTQACAGGISDACSRQAPPGTRQGR